MKVSVRTVVQPRATSDAEADGQDSKQVMHLSHPGDCCCACMMHIAAVSLALLTKQPNVQPNKLVGNKHAYVDDHADLHLRRTLPAHAVGNCAWQSA